MSSRLEITVPPSPPSGGTVTSVDCTAPADLLAVAGVPIVAAGTIILTKVNVAKNLVYCGPAGGVDALPTFRALTAADVPTTTPGGADTNVQFNDAGVFGGTADLTFNKTTKILAATGQISIADGTKAAPSIRFTSRTTTGIYHDETISTSSILFSCNGVLTVRMSTSNFEFYAGTNKMFAMGSVAGIIDVPNSGGMRIWSGVSALTGTVQAAFNRDYILTRPLTVATLPAATAALRGARAYVTDSLGPTFMAIVTGGGAVDSPVYCDGVNWRVG